MYKFLAAKATQDQVMKFTTSQQIKWSFIPEHSPHFGGIWEAAVKSAKFHLKRILADHKLTFEELSTVLCQVEACLNSRSLVPLFTPNTEVIDCLIPGHFLVGWPIQALPEKDISPSLTLLRRLEFVHQIISRILEAVVSRIYSLSPTYHQVEQNSSQFCTRRYCSN